MENSDTVERNYVSERFMWSTYILGAITFILMFLGGYVRVSGAGLACPDWPTCYGKWFPFFDGVERPYSDWLIFVEWIHRFWAAASGAYLILVVYWSRKYIKTHFTVFLWAVITLVSFIIQGIFGGLSVITDLSPFFVVWHIINGFAIIFFELFLAFFATIFTKSFHMRYFSK
ncbi:MAG: COX15/CtaA family protein [Candidatus Heimdallarchaeota archaeon]|nr:COX15/CtaA family protein [Candidatus Heimdallarchaeota archaeon]